MNKINVKMMKSFFGKIKKISPDSPKVEKNKKDLEKLHGT